MGNIWTLSRKSTSFWCWEPQSYRLGLPGRNLQQRGRIIFLILLAKLLLMQPRIWLSFQAASPHCQLIFSISSVSQVLLHKASLNEVFSQSLLVTGIVTWRQHLALGLVKLHEALKEPLVSLVQVPCMYLNISSIRTSFIQFWLTAKSVIQIS